MLPSFYLCAAKNIFEKKKISGENLKCMESLIHLLTYDKFKNALLNSFGHTICALDLHKILQYHKLRNSDSTLIYSLAMCEIVPNM